MKETFIFSKSKKLTPEVERVGLGHFGQMLFSIYLGTAWSGKMEKC